MTVKPKCSKCQDPAKPIEFVTRKREKHKGYTVITETRFCKSCAPKGAIRIIVEAGQKTLFSAFEDVNLVVDLKGDVKPEPIIEKPKDVPVKQTDAIVRDLAGEVKDEPKELNLFKKKPVGEVDEAEEIEEVEKSDSFLEY